MRWSRASQVVPADEARRIVGVPELIYVGNHGLELDGEAAEWGERLQQFLAEAGWPATENKAVDVHLSTTAAQRTKMPLARRSNT